MANTKNAVPIRSAKGNTGGAAKGNGQLTLEGGKLTTGIYQYSLISNEKLVDTKKMVLTK